LNHIHLESTTSTQNEFSKYFSLAKEGQLLSAEIQSNGKGQYERQWDHQPGALAFSLSLKPAKSITLSSLEIPILINQFFQATSNTNLYFKWPNDLMNFERKKCGGILINKAGEADLVVGVGINLNPFTSTENLTYSPGSIFKEKSSYSLKTMAEEIYLYILDNRVPPHHIVELWNSDCCHMNKEVTLTDQGLNYSGEFLGVGDLGQARIKTSDGIKEFFSGSLLF